MRTGSNADSGSIAQCYSTCATCEDQAQNCLSCISGYTLRGSICRQNFFLVINLVLGPGASNSIFATGDSNLQQASHLIRGLHRFGVHFYSIIPNSFVRSRSEPWDNTIQMNSLAAGSVVVNTNVGAGTNTDSTTATNAMNSAIASSSGDGYSIVSSSVSSTGGSTSSGDDDVNLGLILGLSIPLGILRTYLFI